MLLVESYDDLAESVLGKAGGVMMKVLTVLECYGLAICYVVLHSVNWPPLLNLPTHLSSLGGVESRSLSAAIVAACAFPTLLVRPRFFSSLAIVGLAATSSMFFVALVSPALSGLPDADGTPCPRLDSSKPHAGALNLMERSSLQPAGLGIATGISLFAFSGHATFPELYRQMAVDERPPPREPYGTLARFSAPPPPPPPLFSCSSNLFNLESTSDSKVPFCMLARRERRRRSVESRKSFIARFSAASARKGVISVCSPSSRDERCW